MKLWELRFKHYAPCDGEEGILVYLIADSSEQIYDFIKTEPILKLSTGDDKKPFVDWGRKDDPETDVYDENHRQRLIDCCGEMYDGDYLQRRSEMDAEEENVIDAYNGIIHYGWRCVCDEISNLEIDTLRSCGIMVVDVPRNR